MDPGDGKSKLGRDGAIMTGGVVEIISWGSTPRILLNDEKGDISTAGVVVVVVIVVIVVDE